MAEIPKPVGYWCDHEDEPRDARTHEGWDLTDDGQEWTRQPGTISAHTGLDEWDPEQRRCPRAVPVYAIDVPALTAALQRRTQEWAGEQAARVAAEQATIAADQRARQAERELALAMGPTMYADVQKILDDAIGSGPNDGAGAGLVADVALLAKRMRQAQAERGEALGEMREEARTADELRRNRDQLHDELTTARAELDKIRTRDETVGGVLYDIVRRCQTGDLDEHQAVRAIDERLIHPLVAKLQEARAKASLGAGRRRTGAAQLSSVRAERDRLAQLVRDLTDPDPCYFDHHGGCQAHGYLSLKPGEKCPHAEAKELLGTDSEENADVS